MLSPSIPIPDSVLPIAAAAMPDTGQTEQVHGTAVAINGKGVLLLGDAGAGKSDLALRLIDRGARLVADDRVDLVHEGGRIVMSAPGAIAGLLEVRGLGIFRLEPAAPAPLALAVRLVAHIFIERFPDDIAQTFLGLSIAHMRVDPFEASAPIKIEWALDGVRVMPQMAK